jgi:hypothetical protein
MGDVRSFKGANNTIMVKDAHGKIVDNIAGSLAPSASSTLILPVATSSAGGAWQITAYIGGSDSGEELLEVKHWEVYMDEDYAIDQLDGDEGEYFSQNVTEDSKQGVYGPNSYVDDICLVEVNQP